MDALTFIEGHDDSVGEEAKIGILVASDRASSNEYLDEGGQPFSNFSSKPRNPLWKSIIDAYLTLRL